jgi:hypothetical protein
LRRHRAPTSVGRVIWGPLDRGQRVDVIRGRAAAAAGGTGARHRHVGCWNRHTVRQPQRSRPG